MAYDTATTESVLLKYLQMSSNIEGLKAVTISDLEGDLQDAEKKTKNVEIYGFSSRRDAATHQLLTDVSDLQEFGFLIRDDATTELSLTEWGRLCASLFDLPGPVRQTFEQVIRERCQKANHLEHVALAAACITL
ncbi:MAG: hypothetical protein ABSG08_18805 [Terriglobales bacterium]|jgi:hypothetical protein